MLAAVMLIALSLAPPARVGASAVVMDGRAYILGGHLAGGDHAPASTVDVYDFASRQWSAIPAPTPRVFAGAALSRGRLWLVGGLGLDGKATGLVESWGPGEEKWTVHKPLPNPRSRLTVTALGESLLVAGGIEDASGGVKNSRRVDLYDPSREDWTRLADLPASLHGHSAVRIGAEIHVLGGYAGDGMSLSAAAYRYRFANNRWTGGQAMPRARGFFGAAVLPGLKGDNVLMAFGGRQDGAEMVDRWVVGSDAWTKGDRPELPARHRFALADYNGAAYLFGGEEAYSLEPAIFGTPQDAPH